MRNFITYIEEKLQISRHRKSVISINDFNNISLHPKFEGFTTVYTCETTADILQFFEVTNESGKVIGFVYVDGYNLGISVNAILLVNDEIYSELQQTSDGYNSDYDLEILNTNISNQIYKQLPKHTDEFMFSTFTVWEECILHYAVKNETELRELVAYIKDTLE
jgi:hypothetical protein